VLEVSSQSPNLMLLNSVGFDDIAENVLPSLETLESA
jgi:hypothetical protein